MKNNFSSETGDNEKPGKWGGRKYLGHWKDQGAWENWGNQVEQGDQGGWGDWGDRGADYLILFISIFIFTSLDKNV